MPYIQLDAHRLRLKAVHIFVRAASSVVDILESLMTNGSSTCSNKREVFNTDLELKKVFKTVIDNIDLDDVEERVVRKQVYIQSVPMDSAINYIFKK